MSFTKYKLTKKYLYNKNLKLRLVDKETFTYLNTSLASVNIKTRVNNNVTISQTNRK